MNAHLTEQVWFHTTGDGRLFLQLPRSQSIAFETVWFKPHCHMRFAVQDDSEDALHLSFSIPFLICFYFTINAHFGEPWKKFWRLRDHCQREWEVSIHHSTLWISFGKCVKSYEGENGFSFDFADFFMGKRHHRKDTLAEKSVEFTQPPHQRSGYDESRHQAECTRIRQTWWRSRWPGKLIRECWEVTVKDGVPHPGKGTAGYNCGETGLITAGFDTETAEDACEKFAEAVSDYRDRYPL